MDTAVVPLMTLEELLALPDDGVERWLIEGRLREKRANEGVAMTIRNRRHSQVMARIAQLLNNWADQSSPAVGCALVGEVGCRLSRQPETVVGIDVVFVPAMLAAHQPANTTILEGVPPLVVEISSPNDVEEEVNEKIETYLSVGVAHVWLVDPRFRTVTVFRPGRPAELFNETHDISAEPELAGFRAAVAGFFR